MPTIDGHDWTEKRVRFLLALLDDDPSDEQRAAIKAEIASLRATRYAPRMGWRRLLGRGRLPHEH